MNLLESLRGEAVSIGLFKTTAADTKAELRLTSDTLEAANGALDRYARAAGEDLRPTVTSIAYRDRKYVTTATVGVR
uniref:Signal peptide protein n=1 Tax=Ralstonia solanacearum TaxID=305 RepID=A0A0S4WPE5_RALSL